MPYVKRVVICGNVRETKKMYTPRVHTAGAPRERNQNKTPEAQNKVNERHAEEKLRWLLNANFQAGDLHVVLHYYDKPVGLREAEEGKRKFLRILRKQCRALGVPWKYVAATEARHTPHHHIVLPKLPLDIIAATWEQVLGPDSGNVSVKPLDRRGNHAKLARYLMKETGQITAQYREAGLRYKRWSCARGMIHPEPKYIIMSASRWAREPRPSQGWTLLKDDNGDTVKNGVNQITGYPWQEYIELYTGPHGPPST